MQRAIQSALAAMLASLEETPEFSGIELLKTNIRRERGALIIGATIDRDGGVDTDLCEKVSRWIDKRIDDLAMPLSDYRVEVASAGLDRPLLRPDHFAKFEGRAAKVVTTLRISNRTDFAGAIRWARGTAVAIEDPHAGLVEIPYAAIKRANLIYEPAADLRKAKRRALSKEILS